MRIEAAIDVDGSAEDIWRIATDPRLAPRWNSNVTLVTEVSPGTITLGSTWTQTVKVMGVNQVMRATVIECDPPFHGVVRLEGPGNPEITTNISPSARGCRLEQTMDLTIPPGLMGAAMRLGAGPIRDQLWEALHRQKRAVEDR